MKLKFSPINLPYANLIIRPAKKPRKVEGRIFLPYRWKSLNENQYLKYGDVQKSSTYWEDNEKMVRNKESPRKKP